MIQTASLHVEFLDVLFMNLIVIRNIDENVNENEFFPLMELPKIRGKVF